MPQSLHVLLAASLAIPSAHSLASCFSLYDAKNQLVRQTSEPLVDLSRPIGQQVEARFPGHFLVVQPTSDCPEIGRQGSRTVAPYDGADRDPNDVPLFEAAKRVTPSGGTSGSPTSQSGQLGGATGSRSRSTASSPTTSATTGSSTPAGYKR